MALKILLGLLALGSCSTLAFVIGLHYHDSERETLRRELAEKTKEARVNMYLSQECWQTNPNRPQAKATFTKPH